MESIVEIVRIKQVVKKRKATHLITTIRSPLDGAEILRKEIGEEDREVFFVICLNTKNEVVAIHRCHVGSLNASIVHPRDVMKSAILNNAASIIVGHNHPSGNPKESPEDVEVTKRLSEAGKILGIELLDHIIIGDEDRYTSLKEKGFIL